MKRKQQKIGTEESDPLWTPTQYTNIVRNSSSKKYYARFRVGGKLIWRSLKTNKISVAHARLGDHLKAERKEAEKGQIQVQGKILFEHALAAYREKGFRPVTPRNKKDAKALKPAAVTYYEQRVEALLQSWAGLEKMELRRISEGQCQAWADKARKKMSATSFNHTLGVLRNIFDFGIKAGARYENPARAIMRESEVPKALELPDSAKFDEFVNEVENGGGGFSKDCANLVRFLAYTGLRRGEAAYVTWADCDFDRGHIIVRGHPETGLKNRKPGQTRTIPIIPCARHLLQELRKRRSEEPATAFVMKVRECQKAMDRAVKVVKMKHISHHDLRHLFATRCIESGVDIPTVARWLGHADGGALAMRVYGHLRDQHSAAMAQKVTFGAGEPANVIKLNKEKSDAETKAELS